ncbi:MAG: hypothetical protein WC852_04455 [Candidatus Nanoarchaeia archaeon]|jgi:hypothetical protein
MSDEKKNGIITFCMGHLYPGVSNDSLKDRLTVSYNLRKDKTETLQEFLDSRMPKENIFARLTRSDFRTLNEAFGGTDKDLKLPACEYCKCDENNRRCKFYHE